MREGKARKHENVRKRPKRQENERIGDTQYDVVAVVVAGSSWLAVEPDA